MRDEILRFAKHLEKHAPTSTKAIVIFEIARKLRRIVAAEDARLRVAQTDARLHCSKEHCTRTLSKGLPPRCCCLCIICWSANKEAKCACEGDDDN